MVVYRKFAGGFLLSGDWSQEPGIYVVSTARGADAPKRISRSGFNPHFTPDGERVLFSAAVILVGSPSTNSTRHVVQRALPPHA